MFVLRKAGLILAAAVVLAACGGQQSQDESPEAEAEPAVGAEPMEGMDMEDMSDTQGAMMEPMMAHMQMMEGVSGDSMLAVMPMHRQMAANMLAQMTREMRDMNMTADAAWDATVDSLRQDLTRMPEMSGSELQAMMPGHHARMMRLMEMHGTMMEGMQH